VLASALEKALDRALEALLSGRDSNLDQRKDKGNSNHPSLARPCSTSCPRSDSHFQGTSRRGARMSGSVRACYLPCASAEQCSKQMSLLPRPDASSEQLRTE